MLKVKIADTPERLEQGLMFVEDLPTDEGMLFVFNRPHKLAFWGRNTFIPLDIAFIDKDNTIKQISSIKPHDLTKVASNDVCTMALEVNKGYFEDNKIKAGDKIEVDTDDWRKHAFVSFKSIKVAQVFDHNTPIHPPAPQGMPTEPPEVNGEPNPSLPVLDAEDIKRILEDSFDEPELPPEQEALDGQPEETTPEEKPQEVPETPEKEDKEYPVFNNFADAVKWAENNNEVMRISYQTRSGRKIIRDIEPHGQFHADSTMRQILVTFDETVNDIRAFIMSNIENWSFTKKNFQKKFIVHA